MAAVSQAASHDAEPASAPGVVMITGATSGIGLHLASALARRGSQLILVGHSPTHAKRANRTLALEAPDATVDLKLTDLGRLDNVRSLAAEIRSDYSHLDVLVNNAGGLYFRRGLTDDGLERTFALNHLSPFLLTHELLPLLRAGTPSRVVITASEAHRGARLHLDDLQLQHGYSFWTAYAQSKLANVMFTYELHRRMGAEPISVNCFHPGLVRTNLAKDNLLVRPFVSLVYWLFGRNPAEAAQHALALAVSPTFQGQSGSYVIDGRPVRSSSASYDQEAARRLWDASQTLAGIGDDWGFREG